MTVIRTVVGVTLFALQLARVAAQQEATTLYDDEMKVASFAEAGYPGVALYARIQGVVVVRASIDRTGHVVSASALSGNKALIPTSLDNVKKWTFQGSSRDSVILVYAYKLESGVCLGPHSVFQLIRPNFALITGCTPLAER